ncbi:hypothetical protein [Persephonella sp.]
MGKIKKVKIGLKNFILIFLFLTSASLILTGYLFLYTDELNIAKDFIKENKKSTVETTSGEKFEGVIESVFKENSEIYILLDGKKLLLKDIYFINEENINQKILKELSDRAVKGIFFVVSGGFVFLLIILLRSYI